MIYQERELQKIKRKVVSHFKTQPKYTLQSVRKTMLLWRFSPFLMFLLNCEKKGDTKIEKEMENNIK